MSINITRLCFGLASLFLLHSCSSARKATPAQGQLDKDGYNLVWCDEFNTNGAPDSTNWNYEKGFERNEELQWYQPQNAWCQNGILVLEARRETKPNPQYIAGSTEWRHNRKHIQYTSASIKSQGKRTWQYGRFIMRGKIDVSEGLWPAWWVLGVKGHWPANGEIDMMEYYRNKLLANIAYMSNDHKTGWYSTSHKVDSLGGKKWASQFHIWRMDWDENAIALYVDELLLNKVTLDKLVNKDGSQINPFKQPYYMLFDLAIGGQQGGDPVATIFPKRFEVDYVRVYQKPAK